MRKVPKIIVFRGLSTFLFALHLDQNIHVVVDFEFIRNFILAFGPFIDVKHHLDFLALLDSFLLRGFILMLTGPQSFLESIKGVIKREVLDLDKIILREMEYRKLEFIIGFGIFALQYEIKTVLADGNRLAILFDILAKSDSISEQTTLGECVIFMLGEIHRYNRLCHL